LVIAGLTASPDPVDPRNGEVLTIGFSVNGSANVTVVIYDKQDRVIYQFPQMSVGPGISSVQWNGLTSKGTNAPPGSYIIRAVATNGTDTVNSTVEVAVANKGGNVPGRVTPKGRADRGGH
jgi:flagellar hook assembly protein FlgD